MSDLDSILPRILPMLPFLVPIILLQYGLLVWALVALFKPKAPPRFLNRWAWLAIIVLVNLVGPILFLAIGRNQEE